MLAALVLIIFPVWRLEHTPVPLPAYRTGGFADYAHLIFAGLAVYGIAVQIVRAKPTMAPTGHAPQSCGYVSNLIGGEMPRIYRVRLWSRSVHH